MGEQGKKKVGIRYHLNIIFINLSQRNTTFIASEYCDVNPISVSARAEFVAQQEAFESSLESIDKLPLFASPETEGKCFDKVNLIKKFPVAFNLITAFTSVSFYGMKNSVKILQGLTFAAAAIVVQSMFRFTKWRSYEYFHVFALSA